MKTRTLGWTALTLACAALAFSAVPQKAPALAGKHRVWLQDEAAPIITDVEREVFLKLPGERDRDLFIEQFWRQRDSTPGTGRNEFREEYERRLAFADRAFGSGLPGRGRKTDRGRIYITLGPPLDVRRFEGGVAYPAELWDHQVGLGMDQANVLRLLFYRKNGDGDYVLYNLGADSPKSLLRQAKRQPRADASGRDGSSPKAISRNEAPRGWDDADFQAYQAIRESGAVELAQSLISVIPGREGPGELEPAAAFQAETLKNRQRRVDDRYALDFLEHKPPREVSYSLHAISSFSSIQAYQDPAGFYRVHYAVVPERASLEAFGERYFAGWRATIRLAAPDGTTLYQEGKNVPVELHKEELKALRGEWFQFYDAIPVVPGTWTFELLLENTVSKEFTTASAKISIPAGTAVWMSPPLVAGQAARVAPNPGGASRSFQVGDIQVNPAVRNLVSLKGKASLFFQVHNLPPALKAAGIVEFALAGKNGSAPSFRRSLSAYKDGLNVLEALPTEALPAGTYEVRVSVRDPGGREILASRTNLVIADMPLPPSWILAQPNPPVEDAYNNYALGSQYLRTGDLDMAAQELSLARYKKPDSLDCALGYAQVLLARKDYEGARAALRKFVGQESRSYDFYLALGQSAQGAGDAPEAIEFYQKALRLKGDVPTVLNALGDCYVRTGDTAMARQAWQKSLAVDPRQDEIKKKIDALK